ncbi:conjugal transfer protein TraF [Marinobacter hydrocarbonoclasticus]|nr:conjugal transfer protein TraF [Marinobacter nauticus]
MKRFFLGAVALALTPMLVPSVHAVPFADARAGGMGGVGVASGDFTRTSQNPALLTRFQDDDDFYFQLGVGALARDYEDTIDDIDALQANLDAFEALVNSNDPNNIPAAEQLKDEILGQLSALDQSKPEANAGALLGFFVPSKSLGFGLTINGYLVGNGLINYIEEDAQLLEDALMGAPFDQNDIQSNADVQAVGITEVSFSFAREFQSPWLGQFSVGVAPKMQRLDTYYYNANVSDFDEDDITSDDNMTDQTEFNLDVGFHGNYGPWQYGLVGRNLITQKLRNVNNQDIELKPSVIGAVAFQQGGFTAALDLDLIKDESFAALAAARQWARFGVEYDFGGHAQLRAGYRHDLEGNYEDILSLGLGISPGDVFTLDLAGQFGNEDERGAVVQLGLKF